MSTSTPTESASSADTQAEPAERPRGRGLRSLAPRYWPTWCFWAWMRLTAWMPLGVALAIHRWIGRGLYRVSPKLRVTVRRNLELCFPELESDAIDRLVVRHFEALGEGLAECAAAWFAPWPRLAGRFEVTGVEHLQQALAKGKGVILYTGHFTPLEICGRPLRHLAPLFCCVFSRRNNPLLDEIQRRGRLRIAHEVIPSDDVRALLRSLRRNAVVWYAPDQHHRGGVLMPFFHELAMTNIATGKLARLSGATVLPFEYRRASRDGHYELTLHPPLEDFPSADPEGDTRRLVQYLEAFIRRSPEQYHWIHRRFKGRPEVFPDLYRSPRSS